MSRTIPGCFSRILQSVDEGKGEPTIALSCFCQYVRAENNGTILGMAQALAKAKDFSESGPDSELRGILSDLALIEPRLFDAHMSESVVQSKLPTELWICGDVFDIAKRRIEFAYEQTCRHDLKRIVLLGGVRDLPEREQTEWKRFDEDDRRGQGGVPSIPPTIEADLMEDVFRHLKFKEFTCSFLDAHCYRVCAPPVEENRVLRLPNFVNKMATWRSMRQSMFPDQGQDKWNVIVASSAYNADRYDAAVRKHCPEAQNVFSIGCGSPSDFWIGDYIEHVAKLTQACADWLKTK